MFVCFEWAVIFVRSSAQGKGRPHARPEMPFWYCLKRLGSRRSSTAAGTAWSSAACSSMASRSRSSA